MKTKVIILKVFLIALLWSVYIYYLHVDYDHHHIMDKLDDAVIIAIIGVISLPIIYLDLKEYKQERKNILLLTTLTTLFSIAAIPINVHLLKKQDASATVLYAVKSQSFLGPSTSLDFRENGTYSKKDSMIYLTHHDPFNVLKSNTLALKTIRNEPRKRSRLHKLLFGRSFEADTIPEVILYQVDERGHIVDSSTSFRVTQKFCNH